MLARGLVAHSDDPLGAATNWIVEHFEFGVCMFDPPGLRSRYAELERWNGGKWVNFWTEVPARSDPNSTSKDSSEHNDDVEASVEASNIIPHNTAEIPAMAEADTEDRNGHAQSQASEERKQASVTLRRQREHERAHPACSRPARHFIVLPHARGARTGTSAAGLHFGSREKWEKVEIDGVEDEVSAHTGLFIRARNTRYDELVRRVAGLVAAWC